MSFVVVVVADQLKLKTTVIKTSSRSLCSEELTAGGAARVEPRLLLTSSQTSLGKVVQLTHRVSDVTSEEHLYRRRLLMTDIGAKLAADPSSHQVLITPGRANILSSGRTEFRFQGRDKECVSFRSSSSPLGPLSSSAPLSQEEKGLSWRRTKETRRNVIFCMNNK